MTTTKPHIIHKVFVEVNTDSSAKANELNRTMSEFLQRTILKHVVNYFDALENEFDDYHVEIESLEFDIDENMDEISDFEVKSIVYRKLNEIILPIRNSNRKKSIESAFKKEMDQIEGVNYTKNGEISISPNDSSISVYGKQERAIHAIIQFLKTGKLPWWIPTNGEMLKLLSDEQIIRMIEEKTDFFAAQLRKEVHHSTFIQRMVHQFSDDILLPMFIAFYNRKTFNYKKMNQLVSANKLVKVLKSMSIPQRETFWNLVASDTKNEGNIQSRIELILTKLVKLDSAKNNLNVLVKGILYIQNIEHLVVWTKNEIREFESDVEKVFEEVHKSSKSSSNKKKEEVSEQNISSKDKKSSDQKSDSNENSNSKKREEHEERENFLAENAGLVILHPFLKLFFKNLELLEDGQLTDPILAAHYLHYAATGKENDYEFAMTFEKYLCGIPLDEPIEREVEISDKVKDSIDELLKAVLGHWKDLKTESIALLRNEFLSRSGKVILDENTPRVVIERKTVDILLDKLPWGLSIVALPWRKELMYVEW